ncbi:alpha/beta hydrolase-fold protein [Zhouia spongiae]|uniref:Alpha/beta hydrolase-fold protein n=1 Tax=Zhouia spongiae TaxID=2202721 RepID=A0ABY3YRC5_9FLAO|nr:alpha/beta hydrolase-fold protein [Zhouia spongiae]UNZ00310.1 alpha/beta hydrolase-fold protein [Zhouia spongiae]
MKKRVLNYLLVCSIIVVGLCVQGCDKEELSARTNNDSFVITSNYTQTKYRINILYPKGYQPSKSYHTIYLLDGDDYFNETANVITAQEKDDYVLIGIGYAGKNKRGTDYSYPWDKDFSGNSGGAKEFIDFINGELIPEIESKLKIMSSDRTLFGHSLGGYFALYILFQQEKNNPFDHIIAASANIMWYNAYLLDLEQKYYDKKKELNKSLYLSVGDLEGASQNLFHDAFVKQLKKRFYIGLDFTGERLRNTSHRNSPIISFKNGLTKIFE